MTIQRQYRLRFMDLELANKEKAIEILRDLNFDLETSNGCYISNSFPCVLAFVEEEIKKNKKEEWKKVSD